MPDLFNFSLAVQERRQSLLDADGAWTLCARQHSEIHLIPIPTVPEKHYEKKLNTATLQCLKSRTAHLAFLLPTLPSCSHASERGLLHQPVQKTTGRAKQWAISYSCNSRRLSKDLCAAEGVTWWQAKGHSNQNFSLLLFLFYSPILFNSEDQIKNNHQDKLKLPWKKYYVLPQDYQNTEFIADA